MIPTLRLLRAFLVALFLTWAFYNARAIERTCHTDSECARLCVREGGTDCHVAY